MEEMGSIGSVPVEYRNDFYKAIGKEDLEVLRLSKKQKEQRKRIEVLFIVVMYRNYCPRLNEKMMMMLQTK